jgi:hypothetical protein
MNGMNNDAGYQQRRAAEQAGGAKSAGNVFAFRANGGAAQPGDRPRGADFIFASPELPFMPGAMNVMHSPGATPEYKISTQALPDYEYVGRVVYLFGRCRGGSRVQAG